jgi:hypothetical protein
LTADGSLRRSSNPNGVISQYCPKDFRLPQVKSKKIEEKPLMTDVNGRSIMIAAAAFSDQRVRSENRAELLNSGNSF